MNQPKSRNQLIDLCRGILVMMMTIGHTISMLAINPDHWIVKGFITKGWATVCFISLSGFSIGLLFLERIRYPETAVQMTYRLRQRSWQLLLVMFVSNLLMRISKFVLQDDLSTIYNIRWWVGLFTLETPYSISSILIPTALLVFIAPAILKSIVKYKTLPVLVISLILAMIIGIITTGLTSPMKLHYLLRRLFITGDGFFAILPMVFYGIIGISIGTLWTKYNPYVIATTFIIYYSSILLRSRYSAAPIVFSGIIGPARLIIVLLVCLALQKIKIIQPVVNFLSTTGRFSLQSFILHRILIMALFTGINLTNLRLTQEVVFFMVVGSSILGVWIMCTCRLRYHRLDKLFRKLYL